MHSRTRLVCDRATLHAARNDTTIVEVPVMKKNRIEYITARLEDGETAESHMFALWCRRLVPLSTHGKAMYNTFLYGAMRFDTHGCDDVTRGFVRAAYRNIMEHVAQIDHAGRCMHRAREEANERYAANECAPPPALDLPSAQVTHGCDFLTLEAMLKHFEAIERENTPIDFRGVKA